MRFMTLIKGKETNRPPPDSLMQAMDLLRIDGEKAGVLVEVGGLLPSAMGSSIRITSGQMQVTDGPFAEAKELVGGYAVYQTKTKEEVMVWCRRFMQIHIDHYPEWEGECEIRQIFDPNDVPGMQAM